MIHYVDVVIFVIYIYIYIYRFYKIKFGYYGYRPSNKLSAIESKVEKQAFNEYQQELEEIKKLSQINSSINNQQCEVTFDKYVYLLIIFLI